MTEKKTEKRDPAPSVSVALKAFSILVDCLTMSGCQVCGSTPSGKVILGRYEGFLFTRVWREFRGRLCRPHAIQASRAYLRRALLFGWWGVYSLVLNWGVVAIDLASLVRSHFIPEPESPPMPERTTTAERESSAR
jgi:hypothetical protein